jgi:hypothetical protein
MESRKSSPSDQGHRLGVVHDEGAFLQMEGEIYGHGPDPCLEAGEKGFEEFGTIMQENGHVFPSPDPEGGQGPVDGFSHRPDRRSIRSRRRRWPACPKTLERSG